MIEVRIANFFNNFKAIMKMCYTTTFNINKILKTDITDGASNVGRW